MVDFLQLENVSYWNLLHACSSWRGGKEVDRDTIAMLMYLQAAFESKFRVDFEEMGDLIFSELIAKYREFLSAEDIEFIDRTLRPCRNNAVRGNVIPSLSRVYYILHNAIKILVRGIKSLLEEYDVNIEYSKAKFGSIEPTFIDDNVLSKLCGIGLTHVMLIDPEDTMEDVALLSALLDNTQWSYTNKNHKKKIETSMKKVIDNYGDVLASPLLLLASHADHRISDIFLGGVVTQLNKIRKIYRWSFMCWGIKKGHIIDFSSYVDYLLSYDKWIRYLPSEPHKAELTIESIGYDVIRACERVYYMYKIGSLDIDVAVEKIRMLFDFLTKTIPPYILPHRKEILDSVDISKHKFGSFSRVKWILHVIGHMPRQIRNKLKEDINVLNKIATVRPYIVSMVFKSLSK